MTWSEPADFSRRVRRHAGERVSFRLHMLLGVGLTGLLLLCGLVGLVLHGNGGGWPLVWWAVGLGLSLGVVTYLCNAWVPSVVRVNEKGIERQCFREINVYLERWRWSDVARGGVERAEDGGRDFDVLVLYSLAGRCVPLGLPRSVRVAQVREWFERRNVSLRVAAAVEPTPLTRFKADPFAPSETEEASLLG